MNTFTLPGGTQVIDGPTVPLAFAQFYEVRMISDNAIRLYDWPSDVYAGNHLWYGMGKIFITDLPRVDRW